MFEFPLVEFLGLWLHLCHPYVFGFPYARCREISGREMSALIAAFRQLIAGRCSVIYKDNGLFWIHICPRLCQEIIETHCIHSANKSGGKHKSIDRRYCHCHSYLSSLAANLAIDSLSLPRSTMTSGRPDVVAAFAYEHTVSHYGIVHKPCRVIGSHVCLLYTSPSPRDLSTSRMPSSA